MPKIIALLFCMVIAMLEWQMPNELHIIRSTAHCTHKRIFKKITLPYTRNPSFVSTLGTAEKFLNQYRLVRSHNKASYLDCCVIRSMALYSPMYLPKTESTSSWDLLAIASTEKDISFKDQLINIEVNAAPTASITRASIFISIFCFTTLCFK